MCICVCEASVCIIWVSDGPACADRVFVMQHPASSNTKCTTMQCAGDAKITPHQCHTLMPIYHCTLLQLWVYVVMSEPRSPMLVNLTTMHVNLTIPDNNYCVRPWQCYSDYHVNGQSVNVIAMVKFPLPVSVILSFSFK